MRRLLVVAAAGLLVAGCGGGSSKPAGPPLTKAQYQATLRETAKEIGAHASLSGSSKPTQADIDKAARALNDFADQLEKVNPPAAVEKAHSDLIAAIRRLAKDVPGILKKLESTNDPGTAIAAFLGAPAIQNLLKVQQEFKDKGYDINLNG